MTSIALQRDVWLFDVDGTLTPAQGTIDPDFAVWFLQFAREHDVRIVSGGDRSRILRQLGADIVDALTVSYNCLGNSVWMHGVEVSRLQFEAPQGLDEFLVNAPELAAYAGRHTPQLAWRNGMLALSLLGTDATYAERAAYRDWEAGTGVRQQLAESLTARFPQLTAQVAGETSIDIFPRGRDKSQVAVAIDARIHFFADKTAPGGNDHALAQSLGARGDGSTVTPIADWHDTQKRLMARVQLRKDPSGQRLAA